MLEDVPQSMNGQQYADIINGGAFEPGLGEDRTILQDNCPVHNSAKAKGAFSENNISLFPIPPRSPDLNIIENMFNFVKKDLRQDALKLQLTRESKEEFKQRIRRKLGSYSPSRVNKLVDSLPRRISQLIASKGNRLKY